ncbi:MAG: hypothetical protein WC748_08905 [Legionellales bacterium]|jgi:hypothetical protein
MLDPISFTQNIKNLAGVRKSDQLQPELQLVLDNYKQYYTKYKNAAAGTAAKDYYALRVNKLEEWLSDSEKFKGLITAIDQVKTKNLTFYAKEDISGLKNLLNYMGILCEDEIIQASENLYGMLALLDIITAQKDQNELNTMVVDFKRYFVHDEELQRVNIDVIPDNLAPTVYASTIYSRLAELSSGKLPYIYEVFEKKWGANYFSKAMTRSRSLTTVALTFTTAFLPEWLKALSMSSGSRRSSRISSTGLTSSPSSNQSLSNISRSNSSSSSNSNVI